MLQGFARESEPALIRLVGLLHTKAQFRHLTTPGGHVMSVAMTNAGRLGWVSDRRGYRYEATDPLTGLAWPAIPESVLGLAARAAKQAGFAAYSPPDACLVNRYEPGSRLALHQDRNERGLDEPIISISLGLPAIFLWGGRRRADPVRRVRLQGGDVVVFGGPSRMMFHGIAPLAAGNHALAGGFRYNLTLRHAA